MTRLTMIDEVGPVTEPMLEACARARSPTERPIMFSHPMVRAILAGTKTQTRRVARSLTRCTAGKVGDRLWVRETWCQPNPMAREAVYAADCAESELQAFRELRRECGPGSYVPWKPSMHMPRWAARIELDITELRLERLQEISGDDAEAEGVSALVGPFSSTASPCTASFRRATDTRASGIRSMASARAAPGATTPGCGPSASGGSRENA